jgi:formylglycine-generating enzyme required for sulfatase activity
MGSPEDEEGRWDVEGPRHLVTIEPGFWMFDTPCTQALWEAVMGENPSGFKGPDRPVESVSWDQCQEFLKALNSRIDGLRLSLPSEAQWEYACRAGTETPRYREDPDEIAWYSANSGAETHPVAGKEPNAWGLYDMLGNVFEWCEDVWAGNYREESRAAGSEPASVLRVIRGGSWDSVARDVRAAFRYLVEPSYRDDFLGFRCAEFRAGM